MPSKRLRNFLDSNKAHYQTINHPIAFSALELSEITHIPGNHLAKSVIVKTPTKMLMCVVRANDVVDIELLKKALDQKDISLATEQEFAREFPDCEVGAMPPFGNLYEMDVYVSDDLAKDKEIFFNAGNHSEVIKLSYKEYNELVHPKIVRITAH